MPKSSIIILVGVVVFFVALGLVSSVQQDNKVQASFIGKVYVQKEMPATVVKEIEDGWLVTSEYAGQDIAFGKKYFLSGRAYKVPDIGIEETEDPWNYVNGQWFTWISADGQKYSVRIANGYTTAFKVNNSFKNPEMMYTPTFGLGITKIIEMLIFNSVFNTEIMPFVSEASRQIKYFSEVTKPADYYLTKDRGVCSLKGESSFLKVPKDIVPEATVQTVVKKPVYYGINIGETAPLFDMVMLDGRKVNLNEFYGRKTVINIWATWCGICITEFPVINEAYVQNKGANTLAVCADGTVKQIQRIKDKYSAKYPCDFTMTSAIGVDKTYGLKGFPTTYFLDEYGVIKHIKVGGFSSAQEIENILGTY